MKRSLVFCLAVGLAIVGLGASLQCYSCSVDDLSNCRDTEDCGLFDGSCFKLSNGESTVRGCIRRVDCRFPTLAVRYPYREFTFSCCQTNLCNA